jgi:hypothetical protein
MNSKVIVLADDATNSVINVSENPEWGYLRVQQMKFVTDEKTGFLRAKNVTALVPGLVEELQAANFYAGQQLDGKIVIEESLTPFNKKNPERDVKVAGKTGIVCRVEGAPIYRRTRFSFNASAQDVFVQHDNVNELRSAFEVEQSSAIKANEDFNING